MRTRGKRVTAVLLLKRNVLIENMHVEPEGLAHHYGIANIGGFLSGVTMPGSIQARQCNAAPAVQMSDHIFKCPIAGRA